MFYSDDVRKSHALLWRLKVLLGDDTSWALMGNSSPRKVIVLDPLESFGRTWQIVVLIEFPLTVRLLYPYLSPTPDISVVCFGHAHQSLTTAVMTGARWPSRSSFLDRAAPASASTLPA